MPSLLWYRAQQTWLRAASRLLSRVRVEGRERIPAEGAFLLVSTHESFLDPLVVGAWCRRHVWHMARRTLFFSGERRSRFRTWLGKELKPGQRMETVRDLRPEVRQTLDRAEKFLGLAALVAVLLAAVAVALAASRYLRRHLDAAAMMRCLGAPVRQTLGLFVLQFWMGRRPPRLPASTHRGSRPTRTHDYRQFEIHPACSMHGARTGVHDPDGSTVAVMVEGRASTAPTNR